jgi:hypothetical protein
MADPPGLDGEFEPGVSDGAATSDQSDSPMASDAIDDGSVLLECVATVCNRGVALDLKHVPFQRLLSHRVQGYAVAGRCWYGLGRTDNRGILGAKAFLNTRFSRVRLRQKLHLVDRAHHVEQLAR